MCLQIYFPFEEHIYILQVIYDMGSAGQGRESISVWTAAGSGECQWKFNEVYEICEGRTNEGMLLLAFYSSLPSL